MKRWENYCSTYVWWRKDARPNMQKTYLHDSTKKKSFNNIGLLKHGFSVTLSWESKKIFKVFTLVSIHTDFWKPTFSHYVWIWLFATIYYVSSFQSCCTMWICRFGIIYGSYMLVVHTYFSCSSGILEQPVSEAIASSKWTNRTACFFP